MVALITTYLLGGEPVHLNSMYSRGDDFAQQFWTLPYVPGKRFEGDAIYVLTSSRTFSGGRGVRLQPAKPQAGDDHR